ATGGATPEAPKSHPALLLRRLRPGRCGGALRSNVPYGEAHRCGGLLPQRHSSGIHARQAPDASSQDAHEIACCLRQGRPGGSSILSRDHSPDALAGEMQGEPLLAAEWRRPRVLAGSLADRGHLRPPVASRDGEESAGSLPVRWSFSPLRERVAWNPISIW
ncbi:unnamed protein product, partial [Effrenium voratum]